MSDEEYVEFPDEVPEGFSEAIDTEGVVPEYDREEFELIQKRKTLEEKARRQQARMEQKAKISDIKSDIRSLKKQDLQYKLDPVISTSKRVSKTAMSIGKGLYKIGQDYSMGQQKRQAEFEQKYDLGLGRVGTGGSRKGDDKFDFSLGRSGSMSMSAGSNLDIGSVLSKNRSGGKKRKRSKKGKGKK